MSTRALIGYDATPFGKTTKVLAVYLHYDGYPEHVLPILTEGYNSLDDAVKLIHCGADIRGLAHRVTDCDFFDRDAEPRVFNSVEDFRSSVNDYVEYLYLFVDGEWKVFKPGEDADGILA